MKQVIKSPSINQALKNQANVLNHLYFWKEKTRNNKKGVEFPYFFVTFHRNIFVAKKLVFMVVHGAYRHEAIHLFTNKFNKTIQWDTNSNNRQKMSIIVESFQINFKFPVFTKNFRKLSNRPNFITFLQ